MSDICNNCGKEKCVFSSFHGEEMCYDCVKKLKKEEVLNKASEADSATFFKGWTSKDMTTAFFEALGRYIKTPNRKDLNTCSRIFAWACHADHGVSTAASYAMEWAKINLYAERKKWERGEYNE